MTSKWGIWVENLEDGKWMVNGYKKTINDEWKEIPALYESKRKAQSDAKLFNKDSSYSYIAKEYKK